MNLFKKIYTSLNTQNQISVMEWMIKSGIAFNAPIFSMLFRSIGFFGGDLDDIKQAFTSKKNKKLSLMEISRQLGDETHQKANEYKSKTNYAAAKEYFHRSAIYYLLGDWFTYEESEIRKNYTLMIPCYDEYRALCDPKIEKVSLPFSVGEIKAYYRYPKDATDPYPAIIIVQGNDEVKEFNTKFEEGALAKGIAVLNVDPPGWGESGLTGNRFHSLEEYKEAISKCIDFLITKGTIDDHKIGVFGVSFGGMLTHVSAGLDSRISASAGMGGPISDINELRRNIPKAQAHRAYVYTGCKDAEELIEWTNRIDFKSTLKNVNSPALIVHGEKDELVSMDDAYEMKHLMDQYAKLKIIKNGDHMCTHALPEVIAYIFTWFSNVFNAM